MLKASLIVDTFERLIKPFDKIARRYDRVLVARSARLRTKPLEQWTTEELIAEFVKDEAVMNDIFWALKDARAFIALPYQLAAEFAKLAAV